jgi:D-proline reductase (dithiol) PrdB
MDSSTEMDRAPIQYMDRTRRYYRALGYDRDYGWAQNGETPFQPLTRPLREMRIAIVTTTQPPGASPDDDPPPPPDVWSVDVAEAPADFPTHNRAWDRDSTHTRDRESYLPINALTALAAEGVIGGLGPRIYGAPTTYSHRETMQEDAPRILQGLVADHVDAALLVPL